MPEVNVLCYGGDFYEQQEGAAMGSPISAVVANLYMEFFEELALRSAPAKPRLFWKRHVDDTCCIVKKGTVEGLLDHLNSVRPSIGFTVEVKDGGLPSQHPTPEEREWQPGCYRLQEAHAH